MPSSSRRGRIRNLSNSPCEGDHLDASRAGAPECRGSSVGGRTARIDVIDEDDAGRRPAHRPENAAHVETARSERKPALTPDAGRARKERLDGELPPSAKLGGEPRGR